MLLTMDSTFKRALFIAIVIAISTIFAFTAFFYQPNLKQQVIVIYLILLEFLVLATFFIYRNYTSPKIAHVKRLKNPRLQENAFELSKLLIKEFDYIRDTAAQAMNDRHTMVNYFIIITGAFITIIGSRFFAAEKALTDPKYVSLIIGACIIINFIGWIYFMHIIRLRQAWCDSAAAMNQIKEFFVINGRVPDDIARSAFLWDSKTIPRAGKKSNVSYYSAMLISFVSTVVLASASWMLSPAFKEAAISLFTCFLGLYHFIFQMLCYSLFLDYKPIQ
ncbi:MAG: hypothetical protein JSW07_18065 [bacterium]|nr:MAG: hypothetical protein JSW07_18065 [bacterium]